MLIKCPECNNEISDKATACPRCGYPMAKEASDTKPRKRRHTRLPNGFGRITKITGKKLRKPYRAMVSVGKDMYGHPIGKPLKPESYFRTYNEAYAALVEYNKNPYDLDKELTVKKLYEEWSTDYFKRISDSSARTIEAAWRYCSILYDEKAKDIRVRHIKYLLEHAALPMNEDGTPGKEASPNTKERIKSLFNLMYDYALEYEIVLHNYARDFEISGTILQEAENQTRSHMIFTEEEMGILWEHTEDVPYTDIILTQCYSGWRPQELGLIELSDVDLDKWTFTGGIKTKAGKRRVVPIHSKVQGFVEKWYKESEKMGNKYLFHSVSEFSHKSDIRLTYDKYKYRYKNVVEVLRLNPEHRAHDPRKHFITAAKKAGVDEYVIKIIVGHSISDITEATYTQRDLEWIRKEIEKIP